MRIAYHYQNVMGAARMAAEYFQDELDKSKQKIISVTGADKPYKKGFPGFRVLYTPTPEQAWTRAAHISRFDYAWYDRERWRENKAECMRIAHNAETALNSVDGIVILCENEIKLLREFL